MLNRESNESDFVGIVTELDVKLEDFQEEESQDTPVAATPQSEDLDGSTGSSGDPAMEASFMSESIYDKLPSPSPKSLRHRSQRMQFDYALGANCS
jgi:division protein 1